MFRRVRPLCLPIGVIDRVMHAGYGFIVDEVDHTRYFFAAMYFIFFGFHQKTVTRNPPPTHTHSDSITMPLNTAHPGARCSFDVIVDQTSRTAQQSPGGKQLKATNLRLLTEAIKPIFVPASAVPASSPSTTRTSISTAAPRSIWFNSDFASERDGNEEFVDDAAAFLAIEEESAAATTTTTTTASATSTVPSQHQRPLRENVRAWRSYFGGIPQTGLASFDPSSGKGCIQPDNRELPSIAFRWFDLGVAPNGNLSIGAQQEGGSPSSSTRVSFIAVRESTTTVTGGGDTDDEDDVVAARILGPDGNLLPSGLTPTAFAHTPRRGTIHETTTIKSEASPRTFVIRCQTGADEYLCTPSRLVVVGDSGGRALVRDGEDVEYFVAATTSGAQVVPVQVRRAGNMPFLTEK